MVVYRHRGLAETRREDLRRIDNMSVKVTRVVGRILVINAGEASVDIPFPVWFSERPIFTFGGELDENHRPVAGSYPTISAVVINYETVGAVEGFEGRFVAASVAVYTTGQAEQHVWLHYSFEAKAMRNPIHSGFATDETL